jgi:DNA invertase Pin-like site-specific DNA recombinase
MAKIREGFEAGIHSIDDAKASIGGCQDTIGKAEQEIRLLQRYGQGWGQDKKGGRQMDTKQKVAIYARVSSQEQATEGVSIEAQVAALKTYAKSRGWEVFDEYIDGGYSGGTDERPALKRLLLDATQNRFNIIAVCKLDRFFRNLRLLLNHLHNLEQLAIKFVSTQEGFDTSTPYGKFAMQFVGVVAEFERGRIGERVKDSRHYLIGRGDWPGGRTAYGYRWLARERKWEVIAEEADIVQRIYGLYINKKMGIESIAAALNKDGLLTRDGVPWRFSAVRAVLSYPGYMGLHKIGIPMPVIIDERTWQLAQERREKARSVCAGGAAGLAPSGDVFLRSVRSRSEMPAEETRRSTLLCLSRPGTATHN